ncbi:MAG: glycosyltransferase [Candidatus Cloacimonetes bacterium]|nr:glycosyltransferase [Candidatus Cloacimonadota bacterium]
MHRLRIETARDGSPVPIIDDTSIHSSYHPRDEGEKLARRFLAEHTGCGHVVVFGLAFGYHVLPLLDQVEHVTVYEPLPQMIEAARAQSHLTPVFERTTVTGELEALPAGEEHAVLALPSYRRLLPQEWSAFQQALSARATTPDIDLSGLRVLIDYPIYGGSHTTARYAQNALRRLGCQVRGLDNAYADGMLQRILAVPDGERSSQMSGQLTALLSQLLWEECVSFRPHLILFLAQAPVSPELLKTLREKTDALTAFWFVEDYRRFAYWRSYAGLFDGFFSIQTGVFERELLTHGEKHYAYLPMAADESVMRRLDLTSADSTRFGADIAFMGAGYPNRRALFARLASYDLKLWGTGWEGEPALTPLVQNGGARVSPEDTAKIYNATKININLHSSMNAELFEPDGDFINPRTFEIMACGGFQLVDRRHLFEGVFVEGEDFVCFDSLPDLRDKIDYYLAHPEERERIARNGQRKALNHHTYTHRMQSMLQQMLRWHPDWAHRLGDDARRREAALDEIGDPDLCRFIMSRPAAERDDIEALSAAVRERQGSLKNFEATLMALETFYRNE